MKLFQNIDPLYKFLYIFLFKVIGIFLTFLLGTYLYTAPFDGAIILALFIYLTGVVFTISTVKSLIQFVKSR